MVDFSEVKMLAKEFDVLGGSVLDEQLQKGAFILGAEIQKAARGLVPVDTGALKLSIGNSVAKALGGIAVTVGPSLPYGRDVEFGQPPGTYVDPSALAGWAKRKGLNPYAISRGIAKKGTRAQPFLFPAAEANDGKVETIMAQAVDNAIRIALGV